MCILYETYSQVYLTFYRYRLMPRRHDLRDLLPISATCPGLITRLNRPPFARAATMFPRQKRRAQMKKVQNGNERIDTGSRRRPGWVRLVAALTLPSCVIAPGPSFCFCLAFPSGDRLLNKADLYARCIPA